MPICLQSLMIHSLALLLTELSDHSIFLSILQYYALLLQVLYHYALGDAQVNIIVRYQLVHHSAQATCIVLYSTVQRYACYHVCMHVQVMCTSALGEEHPFLI